MCTYTEKCILALGKPGREILTDSTAYIEVVTEMFWVLSSETVGRDGRIGRPLCRAWLPSLIPSHGLIRQA